MSCVGAAVRVRELFWLGWLILAFAWPYIVKQQKKEKSSNQFCC
jgi:hypothetical protein